MIKHLPDYIHSRILFSYPDVQESAAYLGYATQNVNRILSQLYIDRAKNILRTFYGRMMHPQTQRK